MNHNEHSEHDEIEVVKIFDDKLCNAVAEKVLDCAFKIHRQYGPGLLESAYEQILIYELTKIQGLRVEYQKTLPLIHDGLKINAGYRIDLIIDECVIIELKCVEKLLPIHEAQLITYLKLSGIRLGLLINFNNRMLKDGIRRFVVSFVVFAVLVVVQKY